MEKVQELVKEIHSVITQTTGSKKDEVRVMRAMMNDDTYKVDVYDKSGKVDTYCPAQSARAMAASIIAGATKITADEAAALAKNYEFKRAEAEAMVDMSKEFINTYVHTGRKLPLGGRAKSDVSLSIKPIESGSRPFPKVTGTDSKGNKIYGRGIAKVGAYESIKVIAPCPSWIKG